MRAIGRKLDTSSVAPFLWMRIVVAVFHTSGTFCCSMQWPKMDARRSPLGSMMRRWRYSTRSFPGAELDIWRNLLETSSAVGGKKRDSSTGMVGTWRLSCSARASVSQGLWLKMFVKNVWAASVVPSKIGLSSASTFLAARLREWRYKVWRRRASAGSKRC